MPFSLVSKCPGCGTTITLQEELPNTAMPAQFNPNSATHQTRVECPNCGDIFEPRDVAAQRTT